MLDLLLLGPAQNAIAASSITLMQTRVTPALRGRIMSVNTVIVIGIRQLGNFSAAAVITQFVIVAACCTAAAVVAMVAVLCRRYYLCLAHISLASHQEDISRLLKIPGIGQESDVDHTDRDFRLPSRQQERGGMLPE